MHKKKIRRVIFFILFFFTMTYIIEKVLIPKCYYPSKIMDDPMTRSIVGFYEEKSNDLDAVFIGPSHSFFGISPMDIYEEYGIKSYNLATDRQNLAVSYYLLNEAIRMQKTLKLCVLDCSSFYYSCFDESSWRYVLNCTPLSLNKIKCAFDFGKTSGNIENMISVLTPIISFHERWSDLTEIDFTDLFRNKEFYSKGYYMLSMQAGTDFTVESMNDEAYYLHSLSNLQYVDIWNEYGYERSDYIGEDVYSPKISESNVEYLVKIKELCDKNEIQLLIINIPTCVSPVMDNTAWTTIKSNQIKELSSQYGLTFFDLAYDIDNGIDWQTDTRDGGIHLNLLGAEKISYFLGEYISTNYHIYDNYDEKWNNNLDIYNKIKKIGLLQLESDFSQYIYKIMNLDKSLIFIVAFDEMSGGLNKTDKELLKELGAKATFDAAYRSSYILILKDGINIYEAISNRRIEYGYFDGLHTYYLMSSGWNSYPNCSIKIDEREYSLKNSGLNIVVYDYEKNMVLDSVCFKTLYPEKRSFRNSHDEARRLLKYESFLID